MRLQSAIFTLGDTLFTPDGAAREGLDKALSLFKMEGVWLGAVTALSAKDAGFRTVAVRGGAEEEVWRAMRTAAAQSLAQYSELLSDSV